MGRLDELDLSLKLSKEQEAERLAAGRKRLEALRLALGAKLPGYGIWAAGAGAVRGLGRLGQGRRDQAARGAARLAPRARGAVRGADRTRSATTSSGASGPPCRAGAGWPCSTAPGTGACWWSAWRASRPRVSGGRLRRDRRARAHAGRRGHGGDQVLPAPVDEEQLQRFEERRDDPLKAWKLTPDDWENRRKRLSWPRSRRCSSAPTTRPQPGSDRGRERYAREGGGDDDRAHRAGDARTKNRAAGRGRGGGPVARPGTSLARGREGWRAGRRSSDRQPQPMHSVRPALRRSSAIRSSIRRSTCSTVATSRGGRARGRGAWPARRRSRRASPSAARTR